MRKLLAAAVLILSSATLPMTLSAQQTALAAPAYSVISIQPSADTAPKNVDLRDDPHILEARGVPLRELLSHAYDVPPELIFGLDASAASARYDIEGIFPRSAEAKADSALSAHTLLRNMLANQFHLRVHVQQRVVPVYIMTVASEGPKLTPTTPDGTADGIRSGKDYFAGHNVSAHFLATDLSNELHRTVIDRTELKGHFDFQMHWQPSEDRQANTLAIQQATEQDLGLNLAPSMAPANIIIVDHIELASN